MVKVSKLRVKLEKKEEKIVYLSVDYGCYVQNKVKKIQSQH